MTGNNNGDNKRTLYMEVIKLVLAFMIIPAMIFLWQLDRRVERISWNLDSLTGSLSRHATDTTRETKNLGALHHSTMRCGLSSCHGGGGYNGKEEGGIGD